MVDNKLPYYILVFVFVVVFGVCALVFKKTRGTEYKTLLLILFIFASLFLSAVYGWRYISIGHGGIDAINYKYIFDSLDSGDLFTIFEQRVEKGYAFSMWLVKYFGFGFNTFNFLFSIALLILILFISKLLPVSFFSLISISLISLLYIDSFNISRMMMAIFLLFISCYYLGERKYKESLFLTFIAASFQMVALWGIVFVLYEIIFKRIRSKIFTVTFYISAVIVSFIATYAFKEILSMVGYGYYVVDESSYSLLNYIYCSYLFLMYYLFIGNGNNISSTSRVVFRLLPTMIFTLPLYMSVPIAYRFNYIYMLFFYFIIPDLLIWSIHQFKKKNLHYFLIGFFPPIIYALLKFLVYFERDIHSAQEWVLDKGIYLWY